MKSLFRNLVTAPRWASFPLVLTCVVALVAVVYPGGLSATYSDLRDANRLTSDLTQSHSSDRVLTGRLAQMKERVEFKEELVSALVRGQVSLDEVTDQFEEMNRGDDSSLQLMRLRYGSVGDTELAARSVLDYVRIRVAPDGGSSVVLWRLNAEYQRRFGHPAPRD